jgi:hypothetical protein
MKHLGLKIVIHINIFDISPIILADRDKRGIFAMCAEPSEVKDVTMNVAKVVMPDKQRANCPLNVASTLINLTNSRKISLGDS